MVGVYLHTGTEILMNLQGIVQINTMGSDHIVTDVIKELE